MANLKLNPSPFMPHPSLYSQTKKDTPFSFLITWIELIWCQALCMLFFFTWIKYTSQSVLCHVTISSLSCLFFHLVPAFVFSTHSFCVFSIFFLTVQGRVLNPHYTFPSCSPLPFFFSPISYTSPLFSLCFLLSPQIIGAATTTMPHSCRQVWHYQMLCISALEAAVGVG